MHHTKESVRTHADRAGKTLDAMLPEGLGYVLIVSNNASGLAVWNTNLNPQKEAARYFRLIADDLEKNGVPPLAPLDG